MVVLGAPGDGAREAPDARSDPGRLGDRVVVAVLFGLALVVRLGAFWRTAVVFNDGPTFLAIAEQMQAGRWQEAFAAPQHPGYPLLVRVASEVFTQPFDAAIAVSLLFGAASVVPLYVFLAQAWDRRVGVLGALMLAVNPYAARFSADVQSESVYLFFFLCAVAACFGALRSGASRRAAIGGMLSGLAYLTRPEGIGVALVAAGLASVAWLRGGWTGRRTSAWLAALMAGAGVVMAPYLLVVRMAAGDFRLSQKKSLLAILGLEPVDPVGGEGGLVATGSSLTNEVVVFALAALAVVVVAALLARLRGTPTVRVRVGAPALAAALVALALVGAVSAPASFGVFAATVVSTIRPEILLLTVIGVLAGARSGPTGRTIFVTTLVGLYAVVLFGLLLAYGYVSRRHVLPPLTLLLGYAASGGLVLVDALADRMRRRDLAADRASAVAMLGLVVLLVGVSVPKAWHDHRREEVAARRAAEWLAGQAPVEARLASARRKHGWYAGREWISLRHEGRLLAPAELSRHGVRWLLLEGELLDAAGQPAAALPADPGFALYARHVEVEPDAERGRKAVIFELLPVAP